jgi:hypothetical protein
MACNGITFGNCNCGSFVTPPGGDPRYYYFGFYTDGGVPWRVTPVNTTRSGNVFTFVSPIFGRYVVSANDFPAGAGPLSVTLNAGQRFSFTYPVTGAGGTPVFWYYTLLRP